MGDEDRWAKLEQIMRRVVDEALDARGFKSKTRIGFLNGRWTGISADQLAAWREAYGAVDVDAELKKAGAWIISNPHLAPKSNYARFINTWMSRTQDRSAIRSIPTRSEEKKRHCAYCPAVATGMTSGIWSCREHVRDAMEGRPAGHMWGVQAKPVAGDR